MTLLGSGPHYFGLEIEVMPSSGNRRERAAAVVMNTIRSKGIVKADGSVYGGFEICLSPMSLAYHREWWPKVFATRLPVKAWGHESCGLHVHMSRAPISHSAIAKMLRFVGNSANFPFLDQAWGRPQNSYCQREEARLSITAGNRYLAMSTSPTNTIEVRGFKASWNMKAILASVEFCDALREFCSPVHRGLKKTESAREFVMFVVARAQRWPLLYGLFMVGRKFFSSAPPPITDSIHILSVTNASPIDGNDQV
jgi:hypothetical protein